MKYKHYVLAHLPPLALYLLFSFMGWGLMDLGSILASSASVKEGLLPYVDFHFIAMPLTLYAQAGFQQIFGFLSPMTISMLWRGLSYLFLSFVSMVYLTNMLKKFNVKDKIPLAIVYLYPLLFMLLGLSLRFLIY